MAKEQQRKEPDENCKKQLLGKTLRVYQTGDALTDDFVPDRCNIELDPKSKKIVDVWFG